MKVGVLAIQGDYQAHADTLARLGAETTLVKHAGQVKSVQGLVLPGGESTTWLKFLAQPDLKAAIQEAAGEGKAILGTCAGAILLARHVENPAQESLGLVNVTVRRNAYGRQVDSFIGRGKFMDQDNVEMVFIRAPQFSKIGPGVDVLAVCRNLPVMVRQRNVLAATFHPELTSDPRVHNYFLGMC